MNTKLSSKRQKIFWRFMISYGIVILITISIGSLTYQQTFQMVKEDAIKNGLLALEQSREILDTRLMEVENMAIQLSIDNKVRAFCNIKRPLAGSDYEKIRQMFANLPSYRLTNQFILDNIIYFANSDVLVSSSFASASLDLLYNQQIKYSTFTLKEWRERLLSQYQYRTYWPAEKVTINNDQHSVVTYVQTLPLGDFSSNKAIILVLIDEKEIHKTMQTLNIQNSGCYYISDTEGNIITSYGKKEEFENLKFKAEGSRGMLEKTISGEKMNLVYTTSSYNGWSYVAAFPTKAFMKKVTFVRNIYIVTALIIFFFGALIASYLSYRNTIPIKELIKRISVGLGNESSIMGNEYDYLKGTLEKLISNNEHLQTEMENQLPLLRNTFFERLFRNGFLSKQEIQTTLVHIGLEIKGLKYLVMLIRINGYNGEISKDILKELEMARVIVNKTLREIFDKDAHTHNIDNDKIAIIFTFNSSDETEVDQIIEKSTHNILDKLYESLNIRVTLGIGKAYDNLFDMAKSFEEASKALEYKTIERKTRVVWYSKLPKQITKYYFPLDIQTRLVNIIKMGDIDETISIFNNIYTRNIMHNTLSTDMMMQLIYEIKGNVIKIKDQLFTSDCETLNQIENKLSNMDKYVSSDEIFECVTDIYKYMCEKVNMQKKNYSTVLKEKVLEYIHREYIREDCCLYTVASKFDFCEKYFSQLFKELTGENFSYYLEKIRMKRVVELLSDSNKSVKEIAQAVGYGNNTNTFYKAFKRVYGIAPRDYKREIAVEDKE